MLWAYGVTSVSSRLDSHLPATLRSLANGGFDEPHIFLDDVRNPPSFLDKYEVTCHSKRLRTAGHWIVTAWELYVLYPQAKLFAIFQDDLITYRNLRYFLEECTYPERGYWNLYTFPENERGKGWYLSNQKGRGAVALVISNEHLRLLLQDKHLVNRPLDPKRGHHSIDGGVVEAFKKHSIREFVHSPSLVQHTGDKSSMANKVHPKAKSFRGEDFDACELLG